MNVKPYATNSSKNVVGSMRTDGNYHARYRKSVTGQWVDCGQASAVLANGVEIFGNWNPLTVDEAQALINAVGD